MKWEQGLTYRLNTFHRGGLMCFQHVKQHDYPHYNSKCYLILHLVKQKYRFGNGNYIFFKNCSKTVVNCNSGGQALNLYSILMKTFKNNPAQFCNIPILTQQQLKSRKQQAKKHILLSAQIAQAFAGVTTDLSWSQSLLGLCYQQRITKPVLQLSLSAKNLPKCSSAL